MVLAPCPCRQALSPPWQPVARIERSEIRDRSDGWMKAPDFAALNPGYAECSPWLADIHVVSCVGLNIWDKSTACPLRVPPRLSKYWLPWSMEHGEGPSFRFPGRSGLRTGQNSYALYNPFWKPMASWRLFPPFAGAERTHLLNGQTPAICLRDI